MKDLKSLADEAKPNVGSGVVAIAATSEDGKASIVVAVTSDLDAASTPSIWCGSARRRSAARAAAGGPTWRRPAARTAPGRREALAAVEGGSAPGGRGLSRRRPVWKRGEHHAAIAS